ncbi:MAG: RecX family transcriptional regulator [Bacilli bacterium]|nr:RecX family transcriptional regulator [Bacilli bacterium]
MKIEKIKKVGSKYKIILENNDIISTYDEVIINNNIVYKKELNEELINKINFETGYYDIYNKVLKYISIKLRSEYEIKMYLEKQGISIDYSKEIIKKLRENNLINDKVFVRAYIHDKLSFSNDGPYKIKKALINHKIDSDIIEKELNNIDKSVYLEKLRKQILSKIKSNTKYSCGMLKQKLLNYFINLGYDGNDILFILEQNDISNGDIIKREYDKLYNKLKNKYNGEQLKYIIKSKLYQKGFKMEEINEILVL